MKNNSESKSVKAEKKSRPCPMATFVMGDNTHALLGASTEATYLMDPGGMILASNKVAAQRFGVESEEDLCGKSLFELLPEDVARFRKEKVQEVLVEGNHVTFEDESLDRIQTHSMYPIMDDSGEVVRLAVLSTDVTDLRRSDEELRREQQRQIFYMESLPGYVLLLDENYNIRYSNRSFRQIFGRPKARKCWEVMKDRDSVCQLCPAIHVFKTQHATQWEWTSEDTGLTYQAFAHPMTDVDLSPVVMILGIDITARKVAEDRLKQAETYQKAILDNIPDIVWLKDGDGKFVAVNKAFVEICGVPESELLGRCSFQTADPKTAQILQEHDEEVMKSREPLTYEEFIVDSEGNRRWVEAVRIPIFMESGEFAGLTGIAHDVTERRKAVDRLMYSHSEMEKRVSDRTVELEQAVKRLEEEVEERKRTEQQLDLARKKAEVATRAKSVFLANMSHEIRTPLNVILGMTDMALARDDEAKQMRALEMVKEAGSSLLTVINDVLDFSKIEAHKLELECLDFDLHGLLKRILDIHTYQIEEKELKLTLLLGENVPQYVRGDPNRLRQVFNNLLVNAVKFTRQGGIGIEAEKVAMDTLGSTEECVRFRVRDSGIGVPEDKIASIFESFQQADGSTTREFGGTGLGLTISKRLVELMGGKMTLESSEGKGSTFSFTVIFQHGHKEKVLEDEARESKTAELGDLAPMKILLAEDNALNRELATSFLESLGHTVLVATNGKEALGTLLLEPVDLVLMDIQMPIMDGETATKMIRNTPGLAVSADVPIIAMTAHALTGDRERFLEAGMDGYVAKPIDLEKLKIAMSQVTRGVGTAERAVATPVPVAEPVSADNDDHINALPSGSHGRAEALKLLYDNEALLQRLEKVFIRDAHNDMKDLQAVMESEDKAECIRIAHMIKGSAATIGATKACELAKRIEFESKERGLEKLGPMWDALKVEIDLVVQGLEERLGGMEDVN